MWLAEVGGHGHTSTLGKGHSGLRVYICAGHGALSTPFTLKFVYYRPFFGCLDTPYNYRYPRYVQLQGNYRERWHSRPHSRPLLRACRHRLRNPRASKGIGPRRRRRPFPMATKRNPYGHKAQECLTNRASWTKPWQPTSRSSTSAACFLMGGC